MRSMEYVSGNTSEEAPFELLAPTWQEDANCRGARMPEDWKPLFGERVLDLFYFEGTPSPARRKAIESVCGACPVRDECRQWAIEHEVWGYWAGTSPGWRVDERRRQGLTLLTPEVDPDTKAVIGTVVTPTHGTQARYQQHRRLGEKPCEACTLAHNESNAPGRERAQAERLRTETPEQKQERLAVERLRRAERDRERRLAGFDGLNHRA